MNLRLSPGIAGAARRKPKRARPCTVARAETLLREAIAMARHALTHCGDDADVLALTGSRIAVLADKQEGMVLIEQALALNPNSITVINMAAGHYAYAGQAAKALECVARAARINPFEGAIVRNWSAVIAHFTVGEY